jgi:Domain of unknown function (DUF932)
LVESVLQFRLKRFEFCACALRFVLVQILQDRRENFEHLASRVIVESRNDVADRAHDRIHVLVQHIAAFTRHGCGQCSILTHGLAAVLEWRGMSEYDFPVEFRKISTEPDGFVIPNRVAVVRTDTMRPIGLVSKKYALLPHADVVDALRQTFKGQEVQEKIRMTHNGARMHVEITLPNITLKVEGDEIAMRLVVGNSYDASRKVNIAFGAYRVVCSNGMIIGRRLISVSRRHVGEVTIDVQQIRKQITVFTTQFKATAPLMRKMATMTLASPKKFFDADTLHIPTYLTKIASEQFKKEEDGTVWDAYNALTFAITHKMRQSNPELAARLGRHAWAAATAVIRS